MNQNNQSQQNSDDDNAAYLGMDFDDDNETDIFHIDAMTERQNQASGDHSVEERPHEEPWQEAMRNVPHAGHNVIFAWVHEEKPHESHYYCRDCKEFFTSSF